MDNIYKLPLVLDPQPEGGWTITCPILPGLVTEADTPEEVSVNVADAVEALIEAYEEMNQPLPTFCGQSGTPLLFSPKLLFISKPHEISRDREKATKTWVLGDQTKGRRVASESNRL